MIETKLRVPKDKIAAFCKKWKIVEMALFGSVLRADLRPDSDIDVLVTFAANPGWSLFDHVRMQDELTTLLGRNVDLVSRKGIERSRNYIRRKAILDTAEVIYEAA